MRLVGTWRKQSRESCAQPYPDRLELRADGLYFTGGGGGRFTIWDVGRYQVLDRQRIRLSTANDAEVEYRYAVGPDTLLFRDAAGCEILYRRDR